MRTRYPWDKLKKPGDSFAWGILSDERSLRSQANKQGVRRSVAYSVRKRRIKSKRSQKTVLALVVTLVHGVL